MPELPDPTPWPPAEDPGLVVGPTGYETAEDVAFAAELAELDRLDREAPGFYDADLAAPPPWEDAVLSDDDLVAGLAGSAHPADLLLLDSIDPTSLAHPLDRLAYLRALDRSAALVSALQVDAVAAIAGDTGSDAYLAEVHLEHELAVARRTSRYAAGKAVDTARRLRATLPRFLSALRAGDVSPAHCTVLRRPDPAVTDEAVLAAIGRVASAAGPSG